MANKCKNYPVIVIPGITGTTLVDEYILPPEYLWKAIKKKYDPVILHPSDTRYELEQPSFVRPAQIFELAYKELIEELRENLKDNSDEDIPVYPFGYDWRMPLELIEAQLDNFIEKVIGRTKLLKHYQKTDFDKNPKVNLIAHSMGGLIITGYMGKKGKAARVHKIVTLATPYQGSFEAVLKVSTGTANLDNNKQNSRDRKAARLTPALYYLLPSFNNAFMFENLDDSIKSIYDINAWQPSIIDTIKEYVRIHGIKSKNKEEDGIDLFKNLLNQAKAHRDRINDFKLDKAEFDNKNWLAVIGVNAKTRVQLKVKKVNKCPCFDLSSDFRKNEWKNPDIKEKTKTGDGTVPFEGAIPKFLNKENLVLVTPDDFGYWEVKDKVLLEAAGFHGIICNMNLIHRMIVRFFKDGSDKYKNTWGRKVPGVSKGDWAPPIKLEDEDEKELKKGRK